jgi:hypothetical protein
VAVSENAASRNDKLIEEYEEVLMGFVVNTTVEFVTVSPKLPCAAKLELVGKAGDAAVPEVKRNVPEVTGKRGALFSNVSATMVDCENVLLNKKKENRIKLIFFINKRL